MKDKTPAKEQKSIVPLWGFDLPSSDVLVIDQDVRIRRITEKELEVVKKQVGPVAGSDPAYVIEESYPSSPLVVSGLELVVSVGISSEGGSIRFGRPGKIIEAMRLYATGDVRAYLSIRSELSGALAVFFSGDYVADGKGGSYIVQQDEVEGFVNFCKTYLTRELGVLEKSIRRFMRAYSAQGWYDRAVDLVTCMEGLVLPGVDREHRNQFALRIAWILGDTKVRREEVFVEAKRIYDLRSKIVHGEGEIYAGSSGQVLCRRAEMLCRKLLVKAVENPSVFGKERLAVLSLGE